MHGHEFIDCSLTIDFDHAAAPSPTFHSLLSQVTRHTCTRLRFHFNTLALPQHLLFTPTPLASIHTWYLTVFLRDLPVSGFRALTDLLGMLTSTATESTAKPID